MGMYYKGRMRISNFCSKMKGGVMEYQLIRSQRNTVSISISHEGEIVVRAPLYASKRQIAGFLVEKADWIKEKQDNVRRQMMEREKIVEKQEISRDELVKRAKAQVPKRVEEWAKFMGIAYGKVNIRTPKTRWGSCTAKGDIMIHGVLILMPEAILDYVIVHELSHQVHRDHSKEFWKCVENTLPDYRERRKWLKINGGAYYGIC